VREDLKWLAGSLSAVREVGVLLEQSGTRKSHLPTEDNAALEKVMGLLAERRRQARQELLTALDSVR
jgi:CHAD domain-containing protein